jgi:chemotaxis protein MotB
MTDLPGDGDDRARSVLLEKQLHLTELELQRARREGAVAVHRARRQPVIHEAFEPPEEEGWLTVYLDVLTLLLVMLVVMLTFAGSVRDNSSGGVQVDTLSDTAAPVQIVSPPITQPVAPAPTSDPLSGLDTSALGDDIEVIYNDQSVSFRISSEIIFAPAEAELSLDGLLVLRKLLPLLRQGEHRITIAGHTDSLPIRSLRYPSNWELSGARAGSVVRYLEANGIDSQRLVAVGYADTQPLQGNDTATGRAANRRVELILEK